MITKEVILGIVEAVAQVAKQYAGIGGRVAITIAVKLIENVLSDALVQSVLAKLVPEPGRTGAAPESLKTVAKIVVEQLKPLVAGYPILPAVVDVFDAIVNGPLIDEVYDLIAGDHKLACGHECSGADHDTKEACRKAVREQLGQICG